MKEFLGRLGALCWWTTFALNTAITLGVLMLVLWVDGPWDLLWLEVLVPISLVGRGLCYLFRGTLHPMIEVRS